MFIKYIFILLCNIFLLQYSIAQITFETSFGWASLEVAKDMLPVEDGYLLTGYTTSYDGTDKDVILAKLDSGGNVKWYKRYGGVQDDEGISILKIDTNYLVTGYSRSFGPLKDKIFILKVNSMGDTIGTLTYSMNNQNLTTKSVIKTTDGGLAITGNTTLLSTRGNSFLLKLDSSLNVDWFKMYALQGAGIGGISIQETHDSGYILLSYAEDIGNGDLSSHILKLNKTGVMEYEKTFSIINDDAGSLNATLIYEIEDSSYLISGTLSDGTTNQNGWMLGKLNYNLSFNWLYLYEGLSVSNSQILKSTAPIISGYGQNAGNTSSAPLVLKLDTNYQIEKINGFGDTLFSENILGAKLLDNKEIIAFGSTKGYGAGSQDNIYLLKTDSLFEIACPFLSYNTYDTVHYMPELISTTFIELDTFGFWNTPATTVNNITLFTTEISCQCLGQLPQLNFSYSVNELSVNFTESVENSNSQILWVFGDGDSSTSSNPSHTFPDSGTYSVCLYASNDCGTDSICKNVIISADSLTGISDYGINNFKITPNPFNEFINIELKNKEIRKIEILDITTKLVYKLDEMIENNLMITTENWQNGQYIIKLTGNKETYIKKLLLIR